MKKACILLGLLMGAAPVQAWWSHEVLTLAAVQALPETIPAFFRAGEGMIAHCSVDPDVAQEKLKVNELLEDGTDPEHYHDLELLKGRPLPGDRYALVKLCAELEVGAKYVGFVSYAVAEWTQRLALAFAEHRVWPDNPHIQQKCLLYAGHLAHYSEDMCQPLHTTIHYNGRVNANGSSPRTGIHYKIDGIVETLEVSPTELAQGQKIEPLEDLWASIVEVLDESHALVDRVYELEDRLPAPRDKDWKRVPEVVDFATERMRESVRFTAALYLTAWKLSEKVPAEFPTWLAPARTKPGL